MNLATDLVGAVARGEIVAVFQPQVDIATGKIVAVEALARWNHPTLGPVAPDTFIPLAEQNDLIVDIDNFMLDEGCRCISRWIDSGKIMEIAVNVSAAQLSTIDFLDRVQANLERHHLSAGSLNIEITESLPVAAVPEVLDRLMQLSGLGLGISVDDFGTGYSSVARVLSLPATELKLDQSLVQTSDDPPYFLTAAIELAHDHGLRVVAEGVETDEHFARARLLGCDRAQGYFFGRPSAEAELDRVLSAV